VETTAQNLDPSPILVVEDDPALREMLTMVLEEEGYTIIQAANGQEALEQVQFVTPALILLDLMMPVMDGWQFLEFIREKAELQKLPVLLLSANREVALTAEQSQVKAYLPKPFDLDRLIAYVALYKLP